MPKAKKKAKAKKPAGRKRQSALQKLDTMLSDARQTVREDLEQIAARIRREANKS